jgi:hypothetical protein
MGVVLILVGSWAVLRYVQGAIHIETDFSKDYRAARALWHHQSIYAAVNHHPPLTAFFFLPLSYLSYSQAFLFWTCFSVFLYVLGIVLVGRVLAIDLRWSWQVLLFGVALSWYPFLAHIALGQFALLLSACLILGWRELRQGHGGRAGFLFGLATALKIFPGLVAVTLVARRRWRSLGVMTVTTLGGLLGPSLVIPLADVLRYFTEIAPQNSADQAVFPVNSAISGFVSRLLVSGPWVTPIVDAPRLASFLIMGLSLLTVGVLAWWAMYLPATTWGTDIVMAMTCIAMLLVSPITWQHGFTLLILPLGVLLKTWFKSPTLQVRRWGLLAFTLLALPDVELAQMLMARALPERMPWWQSLVLTGGTVALVLLWWLLCRYSAQMDAGDSVSSSDW